MILSGTEARAFRAVCADISDVEMAEGAFDHVICDPPYDKRTQENTRRGRMTNTKISEPMPLGFSATTPSRRALWAQRIAVATRRYALVFSDHESSNGWAEDLERAGLVYVRSGLWVRTGDTELSAGKPSHSGAPQFTGDRPAAGHEVIVIAHKGRRMRWNGGGRAAVYPWPVVAHQQRLHPTEKPLDLMLAILRDFCVASDVIVDPFCGAGTTMVAAKMLGMAGAAGIDNRAKFASLASRRAAAAKPIQHGTRR
jgi:site-specific DNA-methyltransferase (adenine-specific)